MRRRATLTMRAVTLALACGVGVPLCGAAQQAGTFQPGDRILIRVEGGESGDPNSLERQLSDTFTVSLARDITLPTVGVVSLRGILRSELTALLTRAIGRFIRDPVVHAQLLIRISVVGAVARPGFYAVPVDALLSDALMVAGGPVPGAKLGDLRIERLGTRLWQGALLQRAVSEGRTFDEMQLRAGDAFVVPGGGRGSGTYNTVRTVSLLLSIPITIFTLTKIF